MHIESIPINWHQNLSLFASEVFLRTVGDEFGWLGGFSKKGDLLYILPYTVINKLSIRMVRFRTETITVGSQVTAQDEKEFLNSSIKYFKNIKADMIIPASTNTIFRTYPDGATAAPYCTFMIDLNQTEEVIWNKMNSVYRKKIRNASKNGVSIKSGFEYHGIAYDIISDTLKRSSLNFMKRRDYQKFVLDLRENIKIFVAEYQGQIQGCTLFPYSKYCAYSLYGGRIQDAYEGAMNSLNWESIKYFREIGVRRFDFMGVRINPPKGSKQEGIFTFKQRFGGEIIQGYMWKYSFHPIKYMLYNIAVKILRGGDIVDSERHKLEGFNHGTK